MSHTITVTMSDAMRFAPDRIDVRKGETIRFVLQNEGQLRHELVFGEPERCVAYRGHVIRDDMLHSGPNMSSLAHGEHGELIGNSLAPERSASPAAERVTPEASMRGAVAVQN